MQKRICFEFLPFYIYCWKNLNMVGVLNFLILFFLLTPWHHCVYNSRCFYYFHIYSYFQPTLLSIVICPNFTPTLSIFIIMNFLDAANNIFKLQKLIYDWVPSTLTIPAGNVMNGRKMMLSCVSGYCVQTYPSTAIIAPDWKTWRCKISFLWKFTYILTIQGYFV